MYRLIWVFAGHTGRIVGIVGLRFIFKIDLLCKRICKSTNEGILKLFAPYKGYMQDIVGQEV